jgi:hypothetical protein
LLTWFVQILTLTFGSGPIFSVIAENLDKLHAEREREAAQANELIS